MAVERQLGQTLFPGDVSGWSNNQVDAFFQAAINTGYRVSLVHEGRKEITVCSNGSETPISGFYGRVVKILDTYSINGHNGKI